MQTNIVSRAYLYGRLGTTPQHIADFCQGHHIRKMALFGSVVRDDFTPHSDVDVLIELDTDTHMGWQFFGLADELSTLFNGRNVDLTTYRALNPHLRDHILAEALVIYEQR